jgi:hypothetical protein
MLMELHENSRDAGFSFLCFVFFSNLFSEVLALIYLTISIYCDSQKKEGTSFLEI